MSDLVNRQAIKKLKRHNLVEGQFVSLYDIEQLPSVQQKVKTGQWLKNINEKCWWYTCSVCNSKPLKNIYGNNELSPYCPNCGTEMEGVE